MPTLRSYNDQARLSAAFRTATRWGKREGKAKTPRREIAKLCRVKVTGAGVVAYEGEDGLEHVVPHGVYTLKLSDGRYRLTGPAGEYLIVAPERIGAVAYLEQNKADGALQLTEGEWP